MADVAGGGFRLLGDDPYVAENDPLGFDQVSSRIAASILASVASSPFTVGIEGGWGMGKSSMMRRVETELKKQQGVSTVWFNAWSAEGASALEGLVKTVLLELDPSSIRKALRNKKLLRWIRVPILVVAAWLRVGSLVDRVWEQFNINAQARNELRDLLHKAVTDWRDKDRGVEGGRLLVIFVDDLDRTSPEQVFEVFEAVKLYLDAKGFVFVIGYDHTVVSQAILEEKKYGETVTGRDYLEKVIQVTYRIPRPEPQEARGLLDVYAAASNTTGLLDDEAVCNLVIERNRWNPRRIKRFLNSFVMEYALDPDWEQLGAESLVQVLVLYMYFPEFARTFEEHWVTDPFTAFLAYVDEREGLKAEREKWISLDADSPPLYVTLARDFGFVSLIRSIKASGYFNQLVDKMRRSPVRFTTAPEPSADPDFKRIVWLSPNRNDRPPLPWPLFPVRSVEEVLSAYQSGDVVVLDNRSLAPDRSHDIQEQLERSLGPVLIYDEENAEAMFGILRNVFGPGAAS
jgi:KAP family P-loop domain